MIDPQRRITQAYLEFAYKQYAPLIQRLAIRIGIDQTQIEELRFVAQQEVLKCLICYNKSCLFMTFLFSRLEGLFRHYLKTECRARRIMSMPIDLMSEIPCTGYDIDLSLMIEDCLNFLTDKERNIVTELFFQKKTMRQVSEEYGLVASTVCRIKDKAISKMRNRYNVEMR